MNKALKYTTTILVVLSRAFRGQVRLAFCYRYFDHAIALADCIDSFLPLNYSAKDRMLTIQMWLRFMTYKELTAIGIRSRICH